MKDSTDTGEDSLRAPDLSRPDRPRLPSARAARSVISRTATVLEHRMEQCRMVEDAYERIPPDTEENLRADGLGWAANVDWGGTEADIDLAVSPFVNLLTEPDPFVKFKAHLPGFPNLHHALSALARSDAEMLDDWPEWTYQAQLMVHNRVAHGLGIFYWPTPHGWHFQSLHPANLVVPPKAGLNPESWPWAAVVTEFDVADLVGKLADKKAAKEQGWDLGQIRKAIEAYRNGSGSKWPINLDVDGAVHGFHETYGLSDSEGEMTIKGYIFYSRENDGTISEHWLTEQDEVDFLFKREKKHKRMSRVICIFPHSLGSGYLNKVRGVGLKTLPYHDLENRVFNHSIDTTLLSSSLMLRGSGYDQGRMQEMVFGPVSFIPDDIQVEQASFGNPTGGLVQLYREMNAMKAGRNQVFGGNVDQTPNVDKTASGARMRYQEQTQIRGHDVARFYKQVGVFHQARWSRVIDPECTESDPGYEERQEMLQRAVDNGCPPEVIEATRDGKVMPVTVFGEGDPVNQFLAMMDVRELAGQLTPSGRKVFARVALDARLRDPDLVDQLVGKPGALVDETDSRHRQIAQQENAAFQTSDVRIDVAETDNHLIHAGEHTVFSEDTLTQLSEGAISEEQAFSTISRVMAHVGPHLEMLASDPLSENESQDLQRRWADIQNTLRQLGQQLEAKRRAEQEQQLEEIRNPRPSVKDMEVAATEELKRENIRRETDAKIEIMERESKAKLDAMRREMREKARNGEITSLADMEIRPT